MTWSPDPELETHDWGPVPGVEVAWNTSRDPTQAVRLAVWQQPPIYLTTDQAMAVALALVRAVESCEGE